MIEILEEHDERRGWLFRVRVSAAGAEAVHELSLSWADYEYWAGGNTPPADVARAVIAVALDRFGAEGLAPRFDASTLRRRFPDADDAIRGTL